MSDHSKLLSIASLALAILLGFRPDLHGEERTKAPNESATTVPWQANAAEYARIMSQVKWSPVAETMPHRRGGYFEKGKEYTGVPYSSVRSAGRYIGFEVSLRTFRAAVENPRSVLYTENLTGKVSNAATYYGAVCSSYTSYALQCGIWEVSRLHGPDAKEGVELVDPPTPQDVQVGDIIYTPPRPGSHVEIITAVETDGEGKVTNIRVDESRPMTTKTTDRSPASFAAHLADRGRQLFRVTDLNAWRGDNRAESYLFPDYEADAREPKINRTLLLDLGDWVPYHKSQPVKFHVMDRDSRGAGSLVIAREGTVIEEIALDGKGVWERSFSTCGDYTAHVVLKDGSSSQACEFAVCDLELRLPEGPVSLGDAWDVEFDSDNMNVVAVYVWNGGNSYGRYPLFLTEQQRESGKFTIPADLLKKPGDVQVWLLGEHRYGRLKVRKDISVTER